MAFLETTTLQDPIPAVLCMLGWSHFPMTVIILKFKKGVTSTPLITGIGYYQPVKNRGQRWALGVGGWTVFPASTPMFAFVLWLFKNKHFLDCFVRQICQILFWWVSFLHFSWELLVRFHFSWVDFINFHQWIADISGQELIAKLEQLAQDAFGTPESQLQAGRAREIFHDGNQQTFNQEKKGFNQQKLGIKRAQILI